MATVATMGGISGNCGDHHNNSINADFLSASGSQSLTAGPGAAKQLETYDLPKLTSSQQSRVQAAKKFAMEQSIKSVLIKQTMVHQQQQMQNFQSSIQRQQALALMCRVYVGSINFEIKEDTIRQAFFPFGPIKSVSLSFDTITNRHKGFAFIEYDIPEAASLALEQMNGVMMGGRNIKVGRPSNMPQAQPIINQMAQEAKKYNRIYIASIHTELTESDVKSVFEAFGQIVMCRLPPDPLRPDKHRGYGIIEFTTEQAANEACTSMNLFDLGGQFLRVGRCCTPPDIDPNMPAPTPQTITMPTASAVAAATITARINAMEATGDTGPSSSPPPASTAQPVVSTPGVVLPTLSSAPPVAAAPPQPAAEVPDTKEQEEEAQSLETQERDMHIKGPNARTILMNKLRRKNDNTVMILKNMVGPEDLDDELKAEVTDECARYGEVGRVIIYQEKQSEEPDAPVIVKIFVQFSNSSEVEKACSSLNGRYFGGRIVSATAYDQELFNANDLSG